MRWPWKRPRPELGDRPDPDKARDDLARLREQRRDVDLLLRVFREDRAANHYGRNVETLFRGGRR